MADDTDNLPVSRSKDGTFVKGHKGRGGRPKGSKNKATIRREIAVHRADKIMHKALPDVMAVLVREALNGDMSAVKMLLDRTVPAHKAIEGEAGETNNMVQITIQNLTSPHKEDKPGITINGEAAHG
jgi:hypothetical protein